MRSFALGLMSQGGPVLFRARILMGERDMSAAGFEHELAHLLEVPQHSRLMTAEEAKALPFPQFLEITWAGDKAHPCTGVYERIELWNELVKGRLDLAIDQAFGEKDVEATASARLLKQDGGGDVPEKDMSEWAKKVRSVRVYRNRKLNYSPEAECGWLFPNNDYDSGKGPLFSDTNIEWVLGNPGLGGWYATTRDQTLVSGAEKKKAVSFKKRSLLSRATGGESSVSVSIHAMANEKEAK